MNPYTFFLLSDDGRVGLELQSDGKYGVPMTVGYNPSTAVASEAVRLGLELTEPFEIHPGYFLVGCSAMGGRGMIWVEGGAAYDLYCDGKMAEQAKKALGFFLNKLFGEDILI